MTHEVVGSCQGETRMSEHMGISPAEEGWTVANNNETCLVVALNCNVLQSADTGWIHNIVTECKQSNVREGGE
jgi:hypothetical protein